MWKVIICTSIIYFTYILLGGGIFLFLEGATELHAIGEGSNESETYNFSRIEDILLKNGFTEEEINTTISKWESKNIFSFFSPEEKTATWTFFNAFMFTFYVTTTIGYGDVSPQTDVGQVVCILIGVIGIPISMLFFKILGGSFSEAYDETIWLIQRSEVDAKKKFIADIGFYVPWALVLIIAPSIALMFTEEWTFIEGLYFSCITLSTVGLGDYVAGEKLKKDIYYILYKSILLCWMIYGLAFFSMVVDSLTDLYSKYFIFTVDTRDLHHGRIKFYRVKVNIERLDLHFRLLKADKSVKHEFSIWRITEAATKMKIFEENHLKDIALTAEKLKSTIAAELQRRGYKVKIDTISSKGG